MDITICDFHFTFSIKVLTSAASVSTQIYEYLSQKSNSSEKKKNVHRLCPPKLSLTAEAFFDNRSFSEGCSGGGENSKKRRRGNR